MPYVGLDAFGSPVTVMGKGEVTVEPSAGLVMVGAAYSLNILVELEALLLRRQSPPVAVNG